MKILEKTMVSNTMTASMTARAKGEKGAYDGGCERVPLEKEGRERACGRLARCDAARGGRHGLVSCYRALKRRRAGAVQRSD